MFQNLFCSLSRVVLVGGLAGSTFLAFLWDLFLFLGNPKSSSVLSCSIIVFLESLVVKVARLGSDRGSAGRFLARGCSEKGQTFPIPKSDRAVWSR